MLGVGVERVGDVADRARRAERLVLGHVAEPDPEPLAVAEHGLEELGAVRRRQHDVVHARVGELGDLVLEERHAADLEQVLGPALGERQHPGAEASGDDDGLGRPPVVLGHGQDPASPAGAGPA